VASSVTQARRLPCGNHCIKAAQPGSAEVVVRHDKALLFPAVQSYCQIEAHTHEQVGELVHALCVGVEVEVNVSAVGDRRELEELGRAYGASENVAVQVEQKGSFVPPLRSA